MRRGEAGHYLRSPLTVVKAQLQLVLRRWDSLDDEQRRELVTQALTATDNLVHAVDVVEQKIFNNANIAIVLDEADLIPRADDGTQVQNYKVL